MDQISDILKKFNPTQDKYISREFQSYGIYLSEELNDYKHKALYIKLAKTTHRALLEKALSYCKDAKVDRPGALFMWRLKQLKDQQKEKSKETKTPKK
jgi:hypothetical protein